MRTERKRSYVTENEKRKKTLTIITGVTGRMIEVVFFKRTSLFTCVRWHYGSLTEDKEKAGSAKVNKTGHVKKVTVTTNNRTQAGFNSARRKKAKHWAQNQLTKLNAQLSEKYKPIWKCSKRFIPPKTD